MGALRAPGPCLSENALIDFAHGQLATTELASVEEHVASCGACRDVVAAIAVSLFASRSRSNEPETPSQEEHEGARTHYEMGREIARGGMGRVSSAWDRRHERPVAIKTALAGVAGALPRLEREAKITARLQHPGIVPLYEAGRTEAGEPFFVMRLIEGRPLGDVAVEAKTLTEKLALLPKLVAVTEAVAYAHAHRIVHRDLKPSNVIVGAFGETVVIDWGLARELDAPEDDLARAPVPNDDADLTLAGHAIGTPCYMPPEQARGKEVDRRADVYAIGAMLYHVFAGAPPYVGASSKQTIARVLEGPPLPLASRVPELPADLAAIVEKAMARDPSDRYESAAEVAADLTRYVNGQLVSVHTYTLAALVRRWIARHRGIVAMAALLVFALGTTATLATRSVLRERDRADAAKVAAERERATAVAHRQAAEKVVDFVIGELRSRLEPLGRLDLLAGAGNEVLRYYVALGPRSELDDVATLDRRAAALETVATVERAKNALDPALAFANDAIALRERAAALGDRDREELLAGDDHLLVAAIESDRPDYERAFAAAERARAFAARVVERRGATGGAALLAVKVGSMRGGLLYNRGDARAAVDALREARVTAQGIHPETRATSDFDRTVIEVGIRLGFIESETGNDADAALHLDEARAAAMRSLAREPDDIRPAASLARIHSALADLEQHRGAGAAARREYKESADAFELLLKRDRKNKIFLHGNFHALEGLCETSLALPEAGGDCAAAHSFAAGLAKDYPDLAWEQTNLLLADIGFARAELRRGDVAHARQLLAEARTIADGQLAQRATDGRWRRLLGYVHRWSGEVELRAKSLDAARDACARARALAEALYAEQRDDDDLGAELADVLVCVGDVAQARGDSTGAREAHAAAAATLDALLARAPGNAAWRASRARIGR